MTEPTPEEARAICITCNLTTMAVCQFCRYFADFPEVEFNPATMTRATQADVDRIYLELWPNPPIYATELDPDCEISDADPGL
jgi:hypothetical protein